MNFEDEFLDCSGLAELFSLSLHHTLPPPSLPYSAPNESESGDESPHSKFSMFRSALSQNESNTDDAKGRSKNTDETEKTDSHGE